MKKQLIFPLSSSHHHASLTSIYIINITIIFVSRGHYVCRINCMRILYLCILEPLQLIPADNLAPSPSLNGPSLNLTVTPMIYVRSNHSVFFLLPLFTLVRPAMTRFFGHAYVKLCRTFNSYSVGTELVLPLLRMVFPFMIESLSELPQKY